MDKPDFFYPAIDGDGVLYRCAFAAQKRKYHYIPEDKLFDSKKELDNYLGKKPDKADFTLIIEPEPMENALANCKGVIQDILKVTNAPDFSLFVSSNTPTFRDELASIKAYKGNREDMEKPIHYNACYDYLIQTWHAEPVFGIEADDAVAIHQTEAKDSIIVSMDKDLLQVPGWHYNWNKAEDGVFYVDEDEARFHKYVQILAGDSTDNIEGIPGLGDKKAAKLLQQFFGSTEEEFDTICRDYYETFFMSEDNNKYIGMCPRQYMEMVIGKNPLEIYNETKALITIITNEEAIENIQC